MSESNIKLYKPDAVQKSNLAEFEMVEAVDTRSTIRLGLVVILLGFGGFLVWAFYAPLDEGVPASATVTIDTKRKAIQHMTGGTVKKVLIREGQAVKAGDPLIELTDDAVRANYESIKQNYMSQRATESRLVAEIEGHSAINFHRDLMVNGNDSLIKQHMQTQSKLFESRKSALSSELSSIDEAIAGQEALIAGLKSQIENRNVQLLKQIEQQRGTSELAEAGFLPRNQALQLEQSQAELKAVIAELNATKLRTDRNIQELKLRRSQRLMEASKESASSLAEVRKDVLAGRERLDAMAAELGRVQIKAPVNGQVVGLTIASTGGVVTPGQKLMDIVPSEENVVLESRIPTHMIDRVHLGDMVFVRFNAFAHSPQLVAEARIQSISSDVISEQSPTGIATYYLARVHLTDNGLKQLGARQLQPGMGAEVLIKTGERSLLAYILHPLSKRIAASLKEE